MAQRLVLYPGMGKTGTTALQIFLRCSGDELAAHGYSYLGDPLQGDPTTVGSGNGWVIVQALRNAELSDDEVEAVVNAQLPAEGDAIIASEIMVSLTPQQWTRFANLPEVAARDVSVVVANRDLYPAAWSGYNQMIKRHGYSGDCSTYVEENFTVGGDRFAHTEELRTCFGAENLTMFHYESSRHALLEALLSAGGIPTDGLNLARGGSNERPYNRSLNGAERAVMKAVNAKYGTRYSTPLSNLLLRHNPRDKAEVMLDQKALDYLESNFGEQFTRANELYFNGKPVLQICSDELRQAFARGGRDANEPPSAASCRAALRVLLRKERKHLPDDQIYDFLKGLRSELRATKEIPLNSEGG